MTMHGKLPTLNNLEGFKIAYAIKKNKIAIEEEQRLLDELTKTSKQFLEYDQKRLAICLKHSEKDESGNPIVEAGKYKGIAEKPEFNVEMDKLTDEYKAVIDGEKKKAEEYNSAMQEEINFNMHMIGIEDVPEDITVIQMDTLFLMIRDHDGKIENKPPEKPPES